METALKIAIGVFYFLFGSVFGSFYNVYIYRVPKKESLIKGSSHCTTCNHPLSPLDLVPVLSWLFLRGRCRYCKAPISPRYTVVELLTAIIFTLCYVFFGASVKSVICCIFFSILILLTFVDIDHKIVYFHLNATILALGIVTFLLDYFGVSVMPELTIWDRLIGAVCVALPMFVVLLLTGGIGGGDVELFAVAGFFVGWKLILVTLLFSAVFASIYGVTIAAVKKEDRKKYELPFVPFISMGLFIAVFFGNALINWYLGIFNIM